MLRRMDWMLRSACSRCIGSKLSTRATAIGASASSCAARATSSACTARTGCGARPDCSCHAGGRAGASPPAVPGRCRRANANFVWAYDFVFDATAQGQQIKCLTVVDEFTQRMPGHRRGRLDPLQARDRGAVASHQHARSAALPALGQRAGVRQPSDPRVDRRERHRHGADRSGQALAERNQRELQWQASATSA